ncbi:MAG: UAA transporter [Caeruleum heppii]|nr:MAG: UAA transporter [Caeruleum heppii]
MDHRRGRSSPPPPTNSLRDGPTDHFIHIRVGVDSPTPTPFNTMARNSSDEPSSPIRGLATRVFDVVDMDHLHARVVPVADKCRHLALYFACNLGLTVWNKVLLEQFPYPSLLTALHTICGFLGCHILLHRGYFKLSHLTNHENLILYGFSLLYAINIALSNVSLNLVTIPFHQVIRATTPVFTILIHRLIYSEAYPVQTYLSLFPIIVGVGLATYGDYSATLLGFLLTLTGALTAAVKTVVTNRLQTGSLELPALEILYRLSPLAAGYTLLYAWYTGELSSFRVTPFHRSSPPPTDKPLTTNLVLALLGNGILAFLLNVVSFTANKRVGALTMTVAANLKQILTILVGVLGFGFKVGACNAIGMILTLSGGAWYGHVEVAKEGSRRKAPLMPLVNPRA